MNDGTLSLDETRFRTMLSSKYDETAHLFLANGLDSQGNTASIVPMLQQQLREVGIALDIRVGLNSGEVVVRAISNDLHMDYSAVGQTTSGSNHWRHRGVSGLRLAWV